MAAGVPSRPENFDVFTIGRTINIEIGRDSRGAVRGGLENRGDLKRVGVRLSETTAAAAAFPAINIRARIFGRGGFVQQSRVQSMLLVRVRSAPQGP